MAEQQIQAHKVTKPIQLLAAWLVGLVAIDLMFLTAALKFNSDSWQSGALVIFAIANVPMFLLAWFILQTKFRAELQEDTFYSRHLSRKTKEVFRIDPSSALVSRIEALERQREALSAPLNMEELQDFLQDESGGLDWSGWRVALNQLHPQVEEIRAALRGARIPLAEFFGITGTPPELPANWVVSINEHMPLPHQVRLLGVIVNFNFDGFQFWEPVRNASEEEDVYIGSYGVDDYTAITDQLRALLTEEGLEEADIERYQRENYVKRRVVV